MLNSIIAFSVKNKLIVGLFVIALLGYGTYEVTKLPIDAVPDITNNQVQINAVAPSLSPIEVEKQVTFTIENALAGIPGLELTRSFSRNGFAQITAVFEDDVKHLLRTPAGERTAGRGQGIASAGG